MGDWGGLGIGEGGVLGRREGGGFVYGFLWIIEYWLGISFFSGGEVCIFVFLLLLFALFFSFLSFSFLPLLFS